MGKGTFDLSVKFLLGRNVMDIKEVISVWLLGIVSVVIADDRSAVALTRTRFLDFEITLNKLIWNRANIPRREGQDAVMLQAIRESLQRLQCVYAGMLIGVPELTALINQSLERIKKYEENPSGSYNKDIPTASDVLTYWTFREDGRPPIEVVKSGLNAGRFRRLWYNIRACSWLRILNFRK